MKIKKIREIIFEEIQNFLESNNEKVNRVGADKEAQGYLVKLNNDNFMVSNNYKNNLSKIDKVGSRGLVLSKKSSILKFGNTYTITVQNKGRYDLDKTQMDKLRKLVGESIVVEDEKEKIDKEKQDIEKQKIDLDQKKLDFSKQQATDTDREADQRDAEKEKEDKEKEQPAAGAPSQGQAEPEKKPNISFKTQGKFYEDAYPELRNLVLSNGNLLDDGERKYVALAVQAAEGRIDKEFEKFLRKGRAGNVYGKDFSDKDINKIIEFCKKNELVR